LEVHIVQIVISFLFQRNEKRKKLSREKCNCPFGPNSPFFFRPFISERMVEIAFALYKRIPKPYSTASPPLSLLPPPAPSPRLSLLRSTAAATFLPAQI
jgi:hypothetical protein